jgi:hypothetical protein
VQVNPDIRKDKWTEHEDNQLVDLVNTHGSCWAEIARGMAVRAGAEQGSPQPCLPSCATCSELHNSPQDCVFTVADG